MLREEGAGKAEEGQPNLQGQKPAMLRLGKSGKIGKSGEKKIGQISMQGNGATMRSSGIDGRTQRTRRTLRNPNQETT